MPATPPHRLSVAPMMRRTDRHFRYLCRRIARRPLLYTEMVTAAAVVHGDRERLLGHHPSEHPVALQLGGDDPALLAEAARIGADRGFDEIDLNVGCPSERVQSGNFGVRLMGEPGRVARCVEAMAEAVPVPVTVKHRIGFDDRDSYEEMLAFVDTVASAGCARFTVHARKAWLSGLSPKENRDVPPLRYGDVHRLKRERASLSIVINGGIRDLAAAEEHLGLVDGVMIGRAVADDPWLLAHTDRRIFGDSAPAPRRRDLVEAMVEYARERERAGDPVHLVARHLLALYRGVPGARRWRRELNRACREGGGVRELEAALHALPPEPTVPSSGPGERSPGREEGDPPGSPSRPAARAAGSPNV